MLTREVRINGQYFNVALAKDKEFFDEHWRQLEEGKEEPQTYKFLEQHLTRETTMLDIGAWIGTMTIYGARLAKKVIAFEADPHAIESLTANLASNPEIANVEVVPSFIGRESGVATLYSEHYGNNSASSAYWKTGLSSWKVNSINLDEFLASRSVSGKLLVLMDIEGAEYDVVPYLRLFDDFADVTLVLSLHPHLIARTVQKNDVFSKLIRRIKVVWSTARVLRVYRYFDKVNDSQNNATSKFSILKELALTGALSKARKELFFEKK
jgi:FkbM family methyltransferase